MLSFLLLYILFLKMGCSESDVYTVSKLMMDFRINGVRDSRKHTVTVVSILVEAAQSRREVCCKDGECLLERWGWSSEQDQDGQLELHQLLSLCLCSSAHLHICRALVPPWLLCSTPQRTQPLQLWGL